ncbi:MAG: GAF domain-containing protein, partial [Chloroflexota bacterium]|nr:GAF domain-containing protein [Chloroflexota bacterium]
MRIPRSILLTLFLCVLAIGLVVVLGVRLDRAAQEEIVTGFSQRQLLLVEQTAAGIQAIFGEARRDLLHLKGNPGPARLTDALGVEDEEGIATWRGACEQGFSSHLRNNPIYAQLRYIDAGGQELVGVDSDGGAARVIPQDQLRSQAEREFFVAAMQLDAGQIYVSLLEPALGHGGVQAGTPTVRLSTPVFDSQGRRQGVIVLNLLGAALKAHMTRLTAEEKADAWVLDETGVEIINVAHPEREGSDAYEYCQQSGDEVLIALTEDMLAGGQGAGIYLWPEGEGGPPVKRLIAYAPVYPGEGRVWPVGVSVTYDSVLAAHRQTRQILLFLGGSVVVIILAGAALVARSNHERAAAERQARRGEELESLREISLVISAQLELDELLDNIVERGCRLLDARASSVYLVDETKGDLKQVVSLGYARDYTGTRMAPGEGIAGKVLQSGGPLAVDDYHHWEGRSLNWEDEPITASLCVPLRRGEETIGTIGFEELARARSFDEHDLWLAALFASQAAIAIENARLFEAEQEQRELAEALEDAAAAVSSTLDPNHVLDRILEQVERVVPGDVFNIMLIEGSTARVVRWRGYERLGLEEQIIAFTVPLADYPSLAKMAQSGEAVVVQDTAADPDWVMEEGQEWRRSYVAAPIRVGSATVGLLNVDGAQPGQFGPADARRLQAFADHAAVAIENARLYEQAQRRLESLTNLNRASQAVASSLDVKEILKQIVELAGSVVDSGYTSVIILDEEGQPALGAEDFQGVHPVEQRVRSGGVAHHVLESGRPVIVDTISDEGAMSPPLRRPDGELMEANPDIVAAGMRSFAAAPIQVKGRMLGVLFVHSRQPRAFHGQIPLLTTFANQTAVAIENARLYEAVGRELAEREQAEQALSRHNRELALLNRASQAFSSTLDLDQVLAIVLEETRRLLDATACSVWLIE